MMNPESRQQMNSKQKGKFKAPRLPFAKSEHGILKGVNSVWPETKNQWQGDKVNRKRTAYFWRDSWASFSSLFWVPKNWDDEIAFALENFFLASSVSWICKEMHLSQTTKQSNWKSGRWYLFQHIRASCNICLTWVKKRMSNYKGANFHKTECPLHVEEASPKKTAQVTTGQGS